MKSWINAENSLEDIKKKLGFITTQNVWNEVVSQRNKGSANEYKTYIKNYNPLNKIGIRTSLEPIFLYGDGKIFDIYGDNITEKEKMEAINTERNWRLASKHELSPHLYYYGYFKNGAKNLEIEDNNGKFKNIVVHQLCLCVISKGYTMDLSKYYKDNKNKEYVTPPIGWKQHERRTVPGEYYWFNDTTGESKFPEDKYRTLRDDDIYIANQLVDLLQKTATVMNVLCFDLKPENCVIDTNTNEVKLIDWDADWCIYFDFLKPNKKDQSISKLTGLLSTMFMANQFLKWNDWNIFSKYFTEETYKNLLKSHDSFYRRPLIPSLRTLYCSSMETGSGSGNRIMAIHYQKETINNVLSVSELFNNFKWNAKTFKKKCDKIFNILWDKSKYITKNKRYISNKEQDILFLPSSPSFDPNDLSNVSPVVGGKKSIKHKRKRIGKKMIAALTKRKMKSKRKTKRKTKSKVNSKAKSKSKVK
jgi:hypothetical protein